jgi:arsenate reductase
MSERLKILFLCTGNSCRSQMAEGWARHLRGDEIDAVSAGTETHGLNENAVKVMAEAGVDISGSRSKNVSEFLATPFDYVVTVCDNARETCPFFPGAGKVVHAGFDDPPALAKEVEGQEAKLDIYRRVRDEIRRFIEGIPGNLEEK